MSLVADGSRFEIQLDFEHGRGEQEDASSDYMEDEADL